MNEEGWQQFCDEVVDGVGFFLKALVVTSASDMSFTMIRGVNAARCAVNAGGSNFWNLIASVYYLAKEAK